MAQQFLRARMAQRFPRARMAQWFFRARMAQRFLSGTSEVRDSEFDALFGQSKMTLWIVVCKQQKAQVVMNLPGL